MNMALYLCDPDKNRNCKKSGCCKKGGECMCTTKPEYAQRTILDGEDAVWAVIPVKKEEKDGTD